MASSAGRSSWMAARWQVPLFLEWVRVAAERSLVIRTVVKCQGFLAIAIPEHPPRRGYSCNHLMYTYVSLIMVT